MGNKIIVLNKMYSGDYLKQGNLGHEIINLYKSDNDCNYIYLLSSGKLDQKYSGRIECILLVRSAKNHKIEIIGKATGLEEVYGKEDQTEYIKKNNITYAGVLLSDIFKENKSHQEICITFKAEKVVKPAMPIYVQYAKEPEDCPILMDVNHAKQSPRQYISDEYENDYKTLSDIINNKDLWGEEVGYVCPENEEELLPHTIFDICRITHNELAHTNALGYFLEKDKEFANKFLDEVLGIKEGLSNDYKVYRERYNIDLLIVDQNRVIIIENKIKSSINGVYLDKQKSKKDSQLDRYIDKVSKIDNASEKAEFVGKTIFAYLLAPNYNDIKDITKYNKNEIKYQKIFYSELYKLMVEHSKNTSDADFITFTAALKRHTFKYDNKLYEDMRYRFLERLNKL